MEETRPLIPPKPTHEGGRPPIPIEKRFWSKVGEPEGKWGCRIWKGTWTRRQTGHEDKEKRDKLGRITKNGVDTQAHIVMWELTHGCYPVRQIKPYYCGNWLCMEVTHWQMVRDRKSKQSLEERSYWAALRKDIIEGYGEEYREKRRQAGLARKAKRSRKGNRKWWGRKKS